jgi:cytochrome c oxidase cbb3-type subunit III
VDSTRHHRECRIEEVAGVLRLGIVVLALASLPAIAQDAGSEAYRMRCASCHSFGPDSEVSAILAYLRTLNTTPAAKPVGDAQNGERIFGANCSTCHQVNGRGGRLGPDLSRVGSTRLRPALAHKIRHASSYIMSVYAGGYVMDGYQPVTLITRDGRRIRGVKKNEDAFSIQIMDTQERLQGYLKSGLRELVNDDASVMPDFGADRINDRDLDDLLAYLGTLIRR